MAIQARTVVSIVVATILIFILNYIDSVSSIVAFARDGVRSKLSNRPNSSNSAARWHDVCPSERQNPSSCLARRGTAGKWVRDWDYANRSFYNLTNLVANLYQPTPEAPFRWEASWAWQEDDEECKLDTLTNRTELCRVCHALNMTRIYIGGDSLNELFYMSLLGLLGQPRVNGSLLYHELAGIVPVFCNEDGGETTYPDLQIMFGRFDKDPYASLITGQLDNGTAGFIQNNTDGGTIIILNTGPHFGALGAEKFRATIPKFFRWICEIVRPATDLVFVRNTVPGHPQCEPVAIPSVEDFERGFHIEPFESYSEWETYYESEMSHHTKNGIAIAQGWTLFPYFNEYTQGIIMQDFWDHCDTGNSSSNIPKVFWLNVFNMTVLRIDGHMGFQNGMFPDCLHYWNPGPVDWWVHLWFSNLKDLANLL